MNKYYCTFEVSSRMSQYVQSIYAMSQDEAEVKMKGVFGNDYSFCYPEDDFIESKEQGHFNNLIELRPLYTKETMTFGEMRKWTERLNQILGASQINVEKRLLNLAEDFCNLYVKGVDDYDPHVKDMRHTILSYYHMSGEAS